MIRLIREIRVQLNTPVILHSICSLALCEPAATELKSKNAHGYLIYHGVFYTDSFFDFRFDLYSDSLFDSDCALQDKRDFRRILVGRKTRMFFSNTNRTNLTNLFNLRLGMHS